MKFQQREKGVGGWRQGLRGLCLNEVRTKKFFWSVDEYMENLHQN
jgi:hypothetical protein